MTNGSSTASRIAWSLADAAQAVGIGQSTLRRDVSLGRLRATRLGRRIVIDDSVLRAYASGSGAAALVSDGAGEREAAEGLRPTA